MVQKAKRVRSVGWATFTEPTLTTRTLEHRRRMAANNAAAARNLGPNITEVGVESASDITMGWLDL